MADGSTNDQGHPTDGINPDDLASMSEGELRKAYQGAVTRMHEATQASSQALRTVEDLRLNNDDLRQRLDTVQHEVAQRAQPNIFDDEEFMDKVRADPTEALRFMGDQFGDLRKELAEVLKEHHRRVSSDIQAISPEFLQRRDEISDLRKKLGESYTDEQLLEIANAMPARESSPKKDRVMTAATGDRAAVTSKVESLPGDLEEVKKSQLFSDVFGDELDDLDRELSRIGGDDNKRG